MSFANGLTQLSAGHTPLLDVIRPNLLRKPAVLEDIANVTLKHSPTQVSSSNLLYRTGGDL